MRNTIELREEILVAARAEFAQYGLAGARIDRVAKSANASKERLYAHFTSKEALFRQVVAADAAEFLEAVALQPDSVAECVGGIFDLARTKPEHMRMIMWAHLEGVQLDEPQVDGRTLRDRDLAVIQSAQEQGHIDSAWLPDELLIILYSIGMGWANCPFEDGSDDEAKASTRRAAAIEAAARVIAPSGQRACRGPGPSDRA